MICKPRFLKQVISWVPQRTSIPNWKTLHFCRQPFSFGSKSKQAKTWKKQNGLRRLDKRPFWLCFDVRFGTRRLNWTGLDWTTSDSTIYRLDLAPGKKPTRVSKFPSGISSRLQFEITFRFEFQINCKATVVNYEMTVFLFSWNARSATHTHMKTKKGCRHVSFFFLFVCSASLQSENKIIYNTNTPQSPKVLVFGVPSWV